MICLIKPQFECGRSALSKGGVIKNKKYYYEAVSKVIFSAGEYGLVCRSLAVSPVKGGDGNTEFLALFGNGNYEAVSDELIRKVTLC